jgi:hypothetical protein
VHPHVSFPVADTQTAFQKRLKPTPTYAGWGFRERGAAIRAVFISAQPFSGRLDSMLKDLQELWNEGKHRNPNYFGKRIRFVPNPAPSSAWPILPVEEIVISRTNRPVRDFFEVSTREVGRVVTDLGKVLYP